jgi:large subunit ribosomal protein L15
MRVHKRKKSSRMHGKNMGTHGGGARKKRKGSGHRGGIGMSGTGKRADHKKTLVTKLYGHGYFGKQGITSRGAKIKGIGTINVGDIQDKHSPGELDLSKLKILGKGEIKGKFVIKAAQASKSAIEKVKAAGGEIILPVKKTHAPKKVPSAEDKKIVKKDEPKKAESKSKKEDEVPK